MNKSPINGVPLPRGRPFKPGEEARDKGRKGGIKSGQTRSKKKTMRKELEDLLSMKRKGPDGKEHTNAETVAVALIRQAMEGNVKAFEVIRDTIGEKPREQIQIEEKTEQDFSVLDKAFERMEKD